MPVNGVLGWRSARFLTTAGVKINDAEIAGFRSGDDGVEKNGGMKTNTRGNMKRRGCFFPKCIKKMRGVDSKLSNLPPP